MDHEVRQGGVRLRTVWTVSRHAQRAYRTRVGVAWESGAGELSLRLDAIPLSGELLITDWVPSSHPDAGRELIAPAAARGEAAR